MDGYILQLSIDLDNWTGKPNPRYGLNQSLESIWNGAATGTHYYQTGKRALLRFLENTSEFKAKNLDPLDFDPGEGKVIRFFELVAYLKRKNAKASPRFSALTFSINTWLGDVEGDHTFFGQSLLDDDLWNASDFSTDGVEAIIETFQNDRFFSACPAVRAMTPDLFNGGTVKTVNDLAHYLKDCKV